MLQEVSSKRDFIGRKNKIRCEITSVHAGMGDTADEKQRRKEGEQGHMRV